jgi:UDP-GlcNAc:undecaprenyl-phosphate GlcNAc-1-phosphate transferase
VSSTSAWLSALPPFLVASAVCIAVTPVAMAIARRVGAVDHPDAERHLHSHPTPRLGGLAMVIGFTVAVVVFGGGIGSRWPILLVAGAVAALMAVDDVVDLPWWPKLIVVLGAGAAFYLLGIDIPVVNLPFVGAINLGLIALPVTVLWVGGMQVSINLLDGADGVAAGVVGIVAMVAMLAAINRIPGPGHVYAGAVVMSGALMGVCAGFLVYNLPPARTFMGDSGSHFLGVALAAITIVGIAKVAAGLTILVPLIALGLPISDTAWAIVRRRRAGISPTTPDAGHLHHRLQARGMTPMETALTFYLATAVLGCLALVIFGHRTVLDVAIVLCALGLLWILRRSRRRAARGGEAVPPFRGRGSVSLPGRAAAPSGLPRQPRDLE